MKRLLYLIAAFSFLFLLVFPAQAQEKSKEFIQSYEINIDINKDNSVDITESIRYDFENLEKHGIYRNIPLSNDGAFFEDNIEIKNVEVTNESRDSRPFTEKINSGDYRIKIGDPDETVTGVQIYNIKYTVEDVVGFYEDHDEFYWNAIGTEWEVPIISSKVTVSLPEDLNRDGLTIKCFVGVTGSENNCDNQDYSNGVVSFSHLSTIKPGEAFTVVVGFPKDIVVKPTVMQQKIDLLKDNWYLLLPPISLIVMIIWWFKSGRDPEGKGNVIPHYEPPRDLSPIGVGMLVDGKIDNNDISAQIIHLANKGFLRIEHDKKDKLIGSEDIFTIIKKKDISEAKEEFDRSVLNLIFSKGDEVQLSDVKPSKNSMRHLKEGVTDKMVNMGFYNKSPKKVRGAFMVSGFMLGWIYFFIFGFFLSSVSLAGIVSFLITGFIIAVVGYFMPSKTKEGAVVEEEILGFKDYLSVAEKERMKFHNAPEKEPVIFENYLPYAMALGVEEEWATIFEDVYDRQPDWYGGAAAHAGAYGLTSDMGSFNSAVGSSAVSSSGSSGVSGGSAGGGAGGGGGGSW